jgi:voltage-gated potassium channel
MDDRARRVQERFEWPMVIAALLVIPVVWIDSVNASHTVKAIGNVLNWLTWGAFLVEAVVMLYVSRFPTEWLKSHPLDAAVVVLSPPFIPNSFAAIRLFRLFRLLRLGRLLTMPKLLSLDGLRYAAFLVLFVVLIGGAAFATVETNQHLSTWDGIWWAITTVTTVGSNIVPQTTGGRVIAMVIMVAGIGFVAYLTAFVAERFFRRDTEQISEHEKQMLAELQQIRRRLERLER